jgi:hypothetical protein
MLLDSVLVRYRPGQSAGWLKGAETRTLGPDITPHAKPIREEQLILSFLAAFSGHIRKIALVAVSVAAIALAAAPAHAATLPGNVVSSPTASAVVANGALTNTVTSKAIVQSIPARGCNVWVCITVTGSVSGYTVTATQLVGWCGHFQFLFPHQHSNSGTGCNITSLADGSGPGKICVVGWQKTGSTFTKVGEPCETA